MVTETGEYICITTTETGYGIVRTVTTTGRNAFIHNITVQQ
jgi:hypothetical protein